MDVEPVGIAERLIADTEWGAYRRSNGHPAVDVGEMLVSILTSNPESADVARNTLENAVAVQGNLYSAAEPAVSVLAASLVDPRPRWVRILALDLMYLILTGAPVADELVLGDGLLLERCRARVRESLWLIVREALADAACHAAALDVLDLVDPGGIAPALARSTR